MSKNVFDDFTGKYSLSKTLRFELRPVGNTPQMLEENHIIQLDKKRRGNYEKTKPFIDKLHQEFITESLQGVSLESLAGYLNIYKDWKKDTKNTKNTKKIEKKEKELREEIVALFDTKATQWIGDLPDGVKVKKNNKDFLFEAGVFTLLQQKYGKDPEATVGGESVLAGWDKWSGYFKKFFETRKNFYESNGTATAVPTRVVNDNLRRFCDNLKIVEVLKDVDLSELEREQKIVLHEVFTLSFYNACLNQDGINAYNQIIGGNVLENGEKVKGINEYINEHRQKTGEKLPRLKKLDKQIGSDKESFIDAIEDDTELMSALSTFVSEATKRIEGFDKCIQYVLTEDGQSLTGIYFSKEALNTITRRWFANREQISTALIEELKKSGEKNAKFDPNTDEYKFPDFISWQVIHDAVGQLDIAVSSEENKQAIWKSVYYENDSTLKDKDVWQQFLAVFCSEYNTLKLNGHQKNGKDFKNLTQELNALLSNESFTRNESTTEIIKAYADRVLSVYQLGKYFALEKKRQWNPDGLETDDFYTLYDEFYSEAYDAIVKVYNKIRNYMTQKPFNQDKWVLNFENPTLADGWDKNKEKDNTSVILRKDGRYYLAVMEKGYGKVFDDKNIQKTSSGGYEKMVYKQMADPKRDFPKGLFSKKGIETYSPPKEILDIYNKKTFKTESADFSKKDLWALIDFYKACIPLHPSWKLYNFEFQDTQKNENLNYFYKEVSNSAYKIWFDNISQDYIEDKNNNGELFLFEIHNKDWNLKEGKKKTGSKNTHTLYFEQVFSEVNAQNNFVMKLNGEAELFFRPATDKDKLGTRKDTKGNDVIKNKRYAEPKMFFHVPITLNRTAPDVKKFNHSINELLANNPDINIIGIDRGEKHLAYLSVINQKGEILEIKSLNKIKSGNKEVDYASLLEERAKNRENARRDWKSVEQIKDLKKGYISLVVREIADLIIKHNAIVVFEDLNMRFKQVRGGIEKSVYQQLEKALIEKLNFLVNKNEVDPEKSGHVLRAHQLTAPFTTFKEMYKQTGVLFYTQAEYTSQTDPVKGFRKNVYISNSATTDKIKAAIERFDAIGWDDEIKSYYFDYDPINFTDKKYKDSVLSKQWRVYANIPRIKREKKDGYWNAVQVNPNNKLKELFELWEFDNLEGDMQDQIAQMHSEGRLDGTKEFDGKKRNFWQSFIYLFNLILQLRNSTSTEYKKDNDGNIIETIDGVDFISSPVEPFFTTDGGKYTDGFVNMADMATKVVNNEELKQKMILEFNGDANGAYNIARKGAIILRRIAENPEKPELFIAKKEWDKFTQKS